MLLAAFFLVRARLNDSERAGKVIGLTQCDVDGDDLTNRDGLPQSLRNIVEPEPLFGHAQRDRHSAYSRCHPPAIAPMIRNGSLPSATAAGNAASSGSWDRSCSQAKNRTNARR